MSQSLATRGMISGGGGDDANPPEITIIDPPPGTAISPSQRIRFRIGDDIGLRRALPAVSYEDEATGRPRYEIIHDGEEFTADFSGTRVTYDEGGETGYEYSVKRTGGWPAAPTLVPFAFDTAGNEPA